MLDEDIGCFVSRSITPCAFTYATRPLRATATTAQPDRRRCGGDAALNHLRDALQPLGRETDFFRLANSGSRADRQGQEYEDRETGDSGSHHGLPEKDGRIIENVEAPTGGNIA